MIQSHTTVRNGAIHRNRLARSEAASPGSGFLQTLLDRATAGLQAGVSQDIVDRQLDDLFGGLALLRRGSAPESWRAAIAECRRHPLLNQLHEDPFTRRAFAKPRGYAGDAVMLDYVYGREELWPEPVATPLGRAIFRYTTLAPAAEGVRARRGFMADLLDRLAETIGHPHVLSVAAGHLREANLAAAVRRRRLGRQIGRASCRERVLHAV